MLTKTIEDLRTSSSFIPKDSVLSVSESNNPFYSHCYRVIDGPFKGMYVAKTSCIIQKEKTYTEQEYNHIMDLLDREREKNDRLGQAVHKLINIIYKKTFPGVE